MLPLVAQSDLTDYQAGEASQALRAAQAAVRGYCGWHIASEVTETVTVRVWTNNTILLPTLHLVDVTAVVIAAVEIDPLSFEWMESGFGIRSRYGSWPYWGTPRGRTASVTMTHGYLDTPEDIRQVVLAVANRASQTSSAGLASQQVGQVAYRYLDSQAGAAGGVGFLDSELATLNRYRIPVIH